MGIVAAVGAAVSAVSGIQQASAQKKATKAQSKAAAGAAAERRKAEGLRQQAADVSANRERVKAVRQARIRRGQLESSAARTGTSATSGAVGAGAAIQSGLSSGIGFSIFQQDTAGQISASNLRGADITTQGNIKAAKYQSQGATWGAIGGLGSTIFSQADGFKEIKKDFF